jgi:hypothetical protein
MTHASEDALLAFALGTIENPLERADIAGHLDACAGCRAQLAGLERDIGILGGLIPRGTAPRTPQARPRRTRVFALLEAAALLVIGFTLGLGAAGHAHREPAGVLPAYVSTSPPPDSLRSCAVEDATAAGLDAGYMQGD